MSNCIKIIYGCEKHITEWSHFANKFPVQLKEKNPLDKQDTSSLKAFGELVNYLRKQTFVSLFCQLRFFDWLPTISTLNTHMLN